jgi:hypothetical protein
MSAASAVGTLLVLDWWEKLAGASIALTAVLRLCQKLRLNLAEIHVQSSLLLPAPASVSGRSWPISAYYDVGRLRQALAPQQFVKYASWRDSALSPGQRPLLIIVIYRDVHASCLSAMQESKPGDASCPEECLRLSGIRRLENTLKWTGFEIGGQHGFERACIRASDMRAAIVGSSAAVGPLRRLVGEQHRAIALLNFRRHDNGRPMLPLSQAFHLRAAAIRPSRAVRTAARLFIARRLASGGSSGYAVVHLRSNHVAHSIFDQMRRTSGGQTKQRSTLAVEEHSSEADGSVGSRSRRHIGTASTSATGATWAATASCSQRVTACVRRLGRTVRRVAQPNATVVAADLATFFAANQDGSSHRKHAYMKECLMPSMPSLRRWRDRTGLAFNCTWYNKLMVGAGNVRGAEAHGRNATSASRRALSCDAGWLGLVDLTLAAGASSFVAVDVRTPWPSAFLEWIVMLRKAEGGKPSELISC